MDEWAAIEDERLALAEDLSGVPNSAWDTPSLCTEWKVRDVVAHLVAGATIGTGEALGGLVKNGFNFNRFMARDAVAKGAAAPATLLAELRAVAPSRKTPPMTKPVDVLLDTVCHAQDIRRPLGLKRDYPEASLEAVADRLKGYGFPFGAKKHITGLRLVATDAPWTTGDGPEVSGPLEALVMAMAGRRVVLDTLAGPGTETLRARLPAS